MPKPTMAGGLQQRTTRISPRMRCSHLFTKLVETKAQRPSTEVATVLHPIRHEVVSLLATRQGSHRLDTATDTLRLRQPSTLRRPRPASSRRRSHRAALQAEVGTVLIRRTSLVARAARPSRQLRLHTRRHRRRSARAHPPSPHRRHPFHRLRQASHRARRPFRQPVRTSRPRVRSSRLPRQTSLLPLRDTHLLLRRTRQRHRRSRPLRHRTRQQAQLTRRTMQKAARRPTRLKPVRLGVLAQARRNTPGLRPGRGVRQSLVIYAVVMRPVALRLLACMVFTRYR